jgi:uncharacterized membrane protein YjgN (DUF898 family)
MNDNTQARPFPMNDPLPTSTSDGPPLAELPHMLPLRFTGSGSEYFRIWIVNLLLTAVTLGLYYPYAKLRRLRYFFSNTEVGGFPLSFHADAAKLFKGYLLVGALFAAYSLASKLSPTASLVALVMLALLWPALWHSALRFRMVNTGWRGLRLGFVGKRDDAYFAMLPGFVAVALFFALAVMGQDGSAARLGGRAFANAAPAVLLLVIVVMLPYLFWLLRRYQHQHYTLAAQRSQFYLPATAVYGVALRVLGLASLGMMLAAAVVWAIFTALGTTVGLPGQVPDDSNGGKLVIYALIASLAVTAVFQVLVRPYLISRMQNLVWNGTRSQHLKFESALRLRPLMWLTAKNWFLMIVTLGLYFPFAHVATAKLRLEAVSVVSSIDPATLVGLPRDANEAAAGDAAGDMFGIDIGL